MEIVVEFLLFVLELGLQIVMEVLFTQGARGVRTARRVRKAHKPEVAASPPGLVIALLGYAVLGGLAGVLSVLIFPNHFVHSEWLRIGNVIFTPVLAGLVMAAIGGWRRRRDQETIGLERFGCGYVFALGLAGIRFVFAV
jgi:hypothetical protein